MFQVGATCIAGDQNELAQTFVIGSLLCNHLLVRIFWGDLLLDSWG